MSNKVAIVTDSSTYFPEEILTDLDIHIAPLVLIWGEETYEDGVDIFPEEFYRRLQSASVMPTTSQATPKSFVKIFGDLGEQGYDVLAILLSDKLSGSLNSAYQAKEMFPANRIEIVNSHSVAMALGFQVLEVARAAAKGADIEACMTLAQKARQHTGVVFAVDTLEFLHRMGRIGGGRRFLGTALSIKPILEVQEGAIEGVESVRTRKKSVKRLCELVADRVGEQKPVRLATLHANAYNEAKTLLDETADLLQADEAVFSELSPVVGANVGPGTLGLAYMAGM
jgi:DegV family protein with EDD domain